MKRCSSQLSTTPYFPLGEENLIDRILLIEVFQYAISYLAPSDMHTAILVSRRWKEATIDLNKQIFIQITKFLNEHLRAYTSSGPFKLANLNEITNSTLELKENLLTSMGKLREDEFTAIKNVLAENPHPVFFDHLVNLIPLYMNLEKFKQQKVPYFNVDFIMENLDELIRNDCITAVRNFINSKPCFRTSYIISNLTPILTSLGYFKTALEFANVMYDGIYKTVVLVEISVTLANQKQLSRVKEIFEAITDPIYKLIAIKAIKDMLKDNAPLLEKIEQLFPEK